MEKYFKPSGGMPNKVIRPYSHRRLLEGETRPRHRGTADGSRPSLRSKTDQNSSFNLFVSQPVHLKVSGAFYTPHISNAI